MGIQARAQRHVRTVERTPLCPGALIWLVLCLCAAPLAPAAEAPASLETVSFRRDIAPVFVKRCQSCHGPEKSKGKFRLDSFERLMTPGESKAAPIVPGK